MMEGKNQFSSNSLATTSALRHVQLPANTKEIKCVKNLYKYIIIHTFTEILSIWGGTRIQTENLDNASLHLNCSQEVLGHMGRHPTRPYDLAAEAATGAWFQAWEKKRRSYTWIAPATMLFWRYFHIMGTFLHMRTLSVRQKGVESPKTLELQMWATMWMLETELCFLQKVLKYWIISHPFLFLLRFNLLFFYLCLYLHSTVQK